LPRSLVVHDLLLTPDRRFARAQRSRC
jgi:hypothetical protein